MTRLTRTAFALLGIVLAFARAPSAEEANNVRTINHAFRPGERLEYSISWSNILRAGSAVMEVRAENRDDGRAVCQLLSNAWSRGLVAVFYHVKDSVRSVIDAEGLYSLSYDLDQSHGKRKKRRTMIFDQERRIVTVSRDDVTETFETPSRVQDALSALYYLRTRDDLTPGTSLHIDVFDGGKNWAVEVNILGKEKMETILGNIDTIKVVTYPKYEGVFQHKGEIEIWLTDDARRIPVLMRSSISIGSIIATLTQMSSGGIEQ